MKQSQEIVNVQAINPLETIQNVCCSFSRRCYQCMAVNGSQFEHMRP